MVPVDFSERAREVLWHACKLRAEAWLEDHGLDGELNYFDQAIDHDDTGTPGGREAGVWWEVTIGHARDTTPPMPVYAPGANYTEHGIQLPILEWTWSARWEHWAGWFASMRARQRADARSLNALVDGAVAQVASLDAYRATPPWERHQ